MILICYGRFCHVQSTKKKASLIAPVCHQFQQQQKKSLSFRRLLFPLHIMDLLLHWVLFRYLINLANQALCWKSVSLGVTPPHARYFCATPNPVKAETRSSVGETAA